MRLFIATETRDGVEPNYHASCVQVDRIHRATSTCSERSAALNLASRLLVGTKAGFKGCQQVEMEEVACGAYEARLKKGVETSV